MLINFEVLTRNAMWLRTYVSVATAKTLKVALSATVLTALLKLPTRLNV